MVVCSPMTGIERDWMGEGLRFGCTRCGRCCSAPGYVWVTVKEASAIARHIDLPFPAFARRFLRQIGERLSLVERPDGRCIFLGEDKTCSVYAARPRQCRTFPFWPAHIASTEAWARVRERCPGAGTGPLHPRAEIEASAADPGCG